jgi:hypothetical protein
VSASVTERARTTARPRTSTVPAPRTGQKAAQKSGQKSGQKARAPRTGQGTQVATDRAYARRDERLRRLVGGARPQRTAAPTGRAKFVLLVMLLLAGGLVATLWLSTAAAADSYRLKDARAGLTTLSQQDESLHQEVAQLASAPELARQAELLGMVRVEDPARLMVGPDGAVTVVGKPEAARAPAPPPAPTAPTAPAAGAQVGAPLGLPGAGTSEAQQNEAQPDGTAQNGPQQTAVPPAPAQQASTPANGTAAPGTAGHTAGGGTD